MKSFERTLIKIIIIQFLFLFFSQLVFHKYNQFPEFKKITQYEGISKNNYTEFLETLSRK